MVYLYFLSSNKFNEINITNKTPQHPRNNIILLTKNRNENKKRPQKKPNNSINNRLENERALSQQKIGANASPHNPHFSEPFRIHTSALSLAWTWERIVLPPTTTTTTRRQQHGHGHTNGRFTSTRMGPIVACVSQHIRRVSQTSQWDSCDGFEGKKWDVCETWFEASRELTH